MPAGRPKQAFNWNLVDSLCMLDATEHFVAERLLMEEGKPVNDSNIQAKVKFIQRRIKEKYNCNFVQYREKKGENNKIKLRRKMWRLIDNDNVAMIIFACKNYLGMTDRLEQKNTLTAEVKNEVYVCEFPEIKMLPEAVDVPTDESLQH